MSSERSRKIVRADKLFSRIIRRGGRCRSCGGSYPTECAHVIPRRFLKTRWEPLNAVALCRGCHRYFHDYPEAWRRWNVARLGENGYGRLWDLARSLDKVDLDRVLDDLRKAA